MEKRAEGAKHAHYWHYEHTVWEGRTPDEVAVVRYCRCGVARMAYASKWRKIPKGYPDILKLLESLTLGTVRQLHDRR